METIVIAVGFAVIVLVVRELGPIAARKLRRWWRARHEQTECTGCGRPVRSSRAVTIGDTWEAHDGGIGGTGVSTDWHKKCLRRARQVDEHREHEA